MGLAVIVVIVVIVFTLASVVMRGYVLSVLWAWFVVPALGLPPLGVAHAIGLTLVAAMFTLHLSGADGDDKSAGGLIGHAFGHGIAAPVLMLVAGWIVRGFVA